MLFVLYIRPFDCFALTARAWLVLCTHFVQTSISWLCLLTSDISVTWSFLEPADCLWMTTGLCCNVWSKKVWMIDRCIEMMLLSISTACVVLRTLITLILNIECLKRLRCPDLQSGISGCRPLKHKLFYVPNMSLLCMKKVTVKNQTFYVCNGWWCNRISIIFDIHLPCVLEL